MILRSAGPDDRALLEYWDTKPHLASAFGDDDGDIDWSYELPRTVPWRDYLIAETNGRPVGIVVSIDPFEEETHYWGDVAPNQRAIDIWIGEEQDLGRGYGTRMMQLALQRCFAVADVTNVLIDPLVSNRDARRFYEKLGFRELERRVFERERCVVYAISRAQWRAI